MLYDVPKYLIPNNKDDQKTGFNKASAIIISSSRQKLRIYHYHTLNIHFLNFKFKAVQFLLLYYQNTFNSFKYL